MSAKVSSALRIKEAMDRLGMKQADLARSTGIDKSTISQYLSGKYEPSQPKVERLARALHVDESWLLGFDSPAGIISIDSVNVTGRLLPVKHVKEIPILGRISAGMPLMAIENIEGYEKVEDPSLDYALIVKGDSMIGARIFEGDIVYVTKECDCENGDIVIALINGYDATIKRFYKYDHEIILKPENPTMKEQRYNPEEVQLIGKVKEVKFKV